MNTNFIAGIVSLDSQESNNYQQVASQPVTTKKYGYALELEKLERYQAERSAATQAKYGTKPPNAFNVAIPTDGAGFKPLITAEQQRVIDSLAEEYAQNGSFAAFMNALKAHGVHPYQIVHRAKYFVGPGGAVQDRFGMPLAAAKVDA